MSHKAYLSGDALPPFDNPRDSKLEALKKQIIEPALAELFESEKMVSLSMGAVISSLSKRTLMKFIVDGRLAAYRVNGKILIRLFDLKSLLTAVPWRADTNIYNRLKASKDSKARTSNISEP